MIVEPGPGRLQRHLGRLRQLWLVFVLLVMSLLLAERLSVGVWALVGLLLASLLLVSLDTRRSVPARHLQKR